MSDVPTNPIAVLNDRFRKTFLGGKVLMTASVAALAPNELTDVLKAVRSFNAFCEDNDPHGEHDFGSFEVGAQTYYFKIDYYDTTLEHGSADPADPTVTTRVLTIMLASEY